MEKIPVNRPKRSFFNLSHIKSFTADPGRLIPICCEEVVPGDKFVIDQALLVRLNPTVTPFMTDMTAYIHYFFVPYRILDKRWEEFITGGDKGNSDVSLPLFRTREEENEGEVENEWIPELRSFHDYLGLPLEALSSENAPIAYPYLAHCSIFDHYYRDENLMEALSESHPFQPSSFNPKEDKRYYCDVFSKSEGSLFFDFIKSMDDVDHNDIFSVGWKKDYFVGALPSTQRGPGAVFPQNNLPLEPNLLHVTNNVKLKNSNLVFATGGFMTPYPTPDGTTIRFNFDIAIISLDNKQYQSGGVYYVNNSPGTVYNAILNDGNADSDVLVYDPRFIINASSSNDISVTFFVTYKSGGTDKVYGFNFSSESTHFDFTGNTINLQNISGSNIKGEGYPATPVIANSTGNAVTIRELRVAWQLQLFLERSNVVGNRYSELIRGHFGINPRDSRLQRPEYIGGIKFPVSVSEVTQTSESNITPQGHLTGKGLSTEYSRIGKYFATEYGLIMGYLSILPRASYCQGVPRWLLRRSRFDFYFPEFAHVGDQEIYNAEIYATKASEAVARKPFGFRGRFDELRSIPDKVCCDFRPGQSLASWTLCRYFNSLPALNNNFVKSTVPSSSGGIAMDRVLMVPSEPAFNIQVGNMIKSYRPLPVFATPGYVDHPFINNK